MACAVIRRERAALNWRSLTGGSEGLEIPPMPNALDMVFKVNDSPFASKDGKPLTSRELRTRLDQELQHNVALRVVPGDRETVRGRATVAALHLVRSLVTKS